MAGTLHVHVCRDLSEDGIVGLVETRRVAADDAPAAGGGTGSPDRAADGGGVRGQNSGPGLAVARARRWLAGGPGQQKKVRGAREAPAASPPSC